jgi:hypothetical protein
LATLQDEHELMTELLNDLANYCEAANNYIKEQNLSQEAAGSL